MKPVKAWNDSKRSKKQPMSHKIIPQKYFLKEVMRLTKETQAVEALIWSYDIAKALRRNFL